MAKAVNAQSVGLFSYGTKEIQTATLAMYVKSAKNVQKR